MKRLIFFLGTFSLVSTELYAQSILFGGSADTGSGQDSTEVCPVEDPAPGGNTADPIIADLNRFLAPIIEGNE